MKTLGDALKARRKELDQNQTEAAAHFGVTAQNFSIWERGARASIDSDFLELLADYLGTDHRGALVAIGWLPGDEDDAASLGDSGASLNDGTAAFTKRPDNVTYMPARLWAVEDSTETDQEDAA